MAEHDQLDELSKSTLGSYINRAGVDNIDKSITSRDVHAGAMHGLRTLRKSKILQLVMPLLMKTNLGKELAHHSLQTYISNNPNKVHKQVVKRQRNIEKAVSKLTKESMTEQTLELIDAIDTGSTLDIDVAFNEIMANKLVAAVESKREEIAAGLFTVNTNNRE